MDYNYFITELNTAIANMERVKRELEQARDSGKGQSQGEERAPAMPYDPEAKSMADLVTPKQLGLIRGLSRGAALDADEECLRVMRCRTESLAKRAASQFIDHLKNCVAEFQQPRKVS
jgi:hypothetical protein